MTDDPTLELPSVYMDGDVMVVRASALGSCIRALAAYGRYEEVVPIQREQLLERTAQEGHLHEPTVIEYLAEKGYDVVGSQGIITLPIVRNRIEVRGHVDGAIMGWGPVEVKTMSKSRFDDWQRHGLAKFVKYQWQLSAYMYGIANEWDFDSDNIKALYAVKRRDDGLIHVIEIDHPPISFQDIRKKLVQVLQHRKAKTLPPCDITGNEQYWCPFPFLHEEAVLDMDLPDETVLALEELAKEYDTLRVIQKQGEEAEKQKKAIGVEMLKLMDGRDKAEIAGFKITRVKAARETLDLAVLKADMEPADLAKYQGTNKYEYPLVKPTKTPPRERK